MKSTLTSNPKLLLIPILLLGLALRLIHLNSSFWLDEAAQAFESLRPLKYQLDIYQDFQPPLYHLWLHFFTRLSITEWWLRLASLIPGIAVIYFTYVFGRYLRSSAAGLIAALILATSQLHVFYSQELRPYSLACLWGVLSTYLLFRLVNNPRTYLHFAYVVTAVAGLYTVYTFPFLLIGHFAYLLFFKRASLRPLIPSLVLVGLCFLPWLPSFTRQLNQGLTMSQTSPGWSQVVSLPLLKALPITLIKFVIGRLEIDYSWFTIVMTLLAITSWGILIYAQRRQYYWQPLCLIISATLLSAYLVHTAIPVIEPKRFLFLLPLLCLLSCLNISTQVSRRLILVIVGANLIANWLYLKNPDFQREPWREAVKQIESVAGSDSVIVMAFNAPFAPWSWYRRSPLPVLAIGPDTLQSNTAAEIALKPLGTATDIILFDYLMDITDPQTYIHTWINRHRFEETGFYQYPGIGKITFYHRGQPYAFR